ncbi:MAG: hypothetical protein KatS3mg087_1638 [Patescibacteria group bacterium]|nr:MAG: hypothetical protein KatS3mg087_1638 [Patescibacteria group bacterium]
MISVVFFLGLIFATGSAYADPVADYIKKNEGWRDKIYLDTAGHPTIGWGFNLDAPATRRCLPREVINGQRSLTKAEAEPCFQKLLTHARQAAKDFAGEVWKELNINQKTALTDMAYHLGRGGLFKFQRLRNALRRRDFKQAAAEVLDSRYARQTPRRARKNAGLIKDAPSPIVKEVENGQRIVF